MVSGTRVEAYTCTSSATWRRRRVIGAFIAQYNAEWIAERLGYRTPVQARRDALQEAA